jgi:hypothetical protein
LFGGISPAAPCVSVIETPAMTIVAERGLVRVLADNE